VKFFQFKIIIPLFVLALGMWFSTGTVTPYASTIGPESVTVRKDCNYLVNGDHDQYLYVFKMLEGLPKDEWKNSSILRRVLFPILSWPLYKLLGFDLGGYLTSFILNFLAVCFFAYYWGKKFGSKSQVWILWLLSTYPGIMYWVGLPYSNSFIVPACLVAFCLLDGFEKSSSRFYFKNILMGMALGTLACGYDILPGFLLAAFLMTLYQKKIFKFLAFCVGAISVYAFCFWVLVKYFDMPSSSDNTQIYSNILKSYFTLSGWNPTWFRGFLQSPMILVSNFFDSQFWVFAFVFLISLRIF
jgi:hypothetical protein